MPLIVESEGCEAMVLAAIGPKNVADRPASGDQRIGDELPVAAPRHGFGAHDRCFLFCAIRHKLFESSLEFSRLHVVGVAAEPGRPPAEVRGIRAG